MTWWDDNYGSGGYCYAPTWTSSGCDSYIARPDPEEVMEVLASAAVDIGELKE